MRDSIDYGQLMQKALRHVVAQVLSDVARHGLPGQHHFYISFSTAHPGVMLPDWLRERYPEEMTIVLQEWFRDLMVDDEGFTVTLNFSNEEIPLRIPFAAIRTFVDPSVEFGLRFDETETTDAARADGADSAPEPPPRPAPAEPDGDGAARDDDTPGQVVSLDAFRK